MTLAGWNARVFVSWVVAAALGLGCAEAGGPATKPATPATPAPPPKRVEIGRRLPHTGCRPLGPIKGSAGSGGWDSADAKVSDAYARLKTAAAGAGGDYARIEKESTDATGATTVTGTAYDCSQQPPAEAQAQSPAGDAEGPGAPGSAAPGPAWPPPSMRPPPPPSASAAPAAAPPAAPAPTLTVEDRLRRLDQLKAQGLITPEEHAARRRAILDEL